MRITRGGDRWLREAAICRVLPVLPKRLYEWIQAGAVRAERAQRHRITWVSVEDVLYLLCTPINETRKRGIHRVRPEVSERSRQKLKEINERSRDFAKNHREQWTTEHLELICAPDRPCDEDLSRIVGHTVSSIVTMRNRYCGTQQTLYDRVELEARLAEEFGRKT